MVLYAQSTTKYYIRAEGDFHKEIYIVERTKKEEMRPEEQRESGELSGEFMERNTVERATKTKKQTQKQHKKEWASSVGLCQT